MRNASRGARIGIFGQPMCIQMDVGGEGGNGARADMCPRRGFKLQFQGAGAHPWILGRRNSVARGIYDWSVADDRVFGNQSFAEAQ